MADVKLAETKLTPTTSGIPCSIQVTGGTVVGADGKSVTALPLEGGGTCTVMIVEGRPPPQEINNAYSNLVLASLAIGLLFAALLGGTIVFGMMHNLTKTMDKLAQLLSEDEAGHAKMSLSRVQALIFTYVITFGSLLIIARTGQFPAQIPDSLAILAGGSLATYVISKGIQKTTDKPPQ